MDRVSVTSAGVLAVFIDDVLLSLEFVIHDVLHVPNHLGAHFVVCFFFALEVRQNLAFVLCREQMHLDAALLSEAIAAAHGLIELLE